MSNDNASGNLIGCCFSVSHCECLRDVFLTLDKILMGACDKPYGCWRKARRLLQVQSTAILNRGSTGFSGGLHHCTRPRLKTSFGPSFTDAYSAAKKQNSLSTLSLLLPLCSTGPCFSYLACVSSCTSLSLPWLMSLSLAQLVCSCVALSQPASPSLADEELDSLLASMGFQISCT